MNKWRGTERRELERVRSGVGGKREETERDRETCEGGKREKIEGH